jgi:uncharacterized protein (UPF0335 family)
MEAAVFEKGYPNYDAVSRGMGDLKFTTAGDYMMNDTTTDTYTVTADELRSFIERYERLEAEVKYLKDSQKEVMAEAKGRGYDTKVMRKIIAMRKRNRDDIANEEAITELYMEALGM